MSMRWSNDEKPMPETDPEDHRPRIYVAVGQTAAGEERPAGGWVVVGGDEDELRTAITTTLVEAAAEPSEDWRIADYRFFGGIALQPRETPETVVRLAGGLTKHGPAFSAWTRAAGAEHADERSFLEHYLGSWKDLLAFGVEFAGDLGLGRHLSGVPPDLMHYLRFDYESMVRDMANRGEITPMADGDRWHVFLARQPLAEEQPPEEALLPTAGSAGAPMHGTSTR